MGVNKLSAECLYMASIYHKHENQKIFADIYHIPEKICDGLPKISSSQRPESLGILQGDLASKSFNAKILYPHMKHSWYNRESNLMVPVTFFLKIDKNPKSHFSHISDQWNLTKNSKQKIIILYLHIFWQFCCTILSQISERSDKNWRSKCDLKESWQTTGS